MSKGDLYVYYRCEIQPEKLGRHGLRLFHHNNQENYVCYDNEGFFSSKDERRKFGIVPDERYFKSTFKCL